MQEITISGVMVRSKVPGRRDGTTYTLTDRTGFGSITFTDFNTPFDSSEPSMLQGVTMVLNMDTSKARVIDPLTGQ